MIEQTYQDLMNKLSLIAHRMAEARKALSDAAQASKATARMMDEEKLEILIAMGGYARLGSNEKERETNLQNHLRLSPSYQGIERNQRNAEQQQANYQRQLEDIKTEFDSLRLQVTLHADYMKYSALVASKPSVADLLGL